MTAHAASHVYFGLYPPASLPSPTPLSCRRRSTARSSRWSAQAAKAHPAGILFILQITTAVLSAFLDNVTTVLLIVPVILAICKTLKVPAYPYLFAEIFASNIRGTATLIGDPPNILIGSQAGLSFNEFVYHLTPVIIVVMVVQAIIIHWLPASANATARPSAS
jgi:Na+/H+ antiporter NhaD/arsenite permease-like protein